MKRRTRRILFWAAVLVFGVSSFVIIRYAQGYKYDFTAHRFVLTGAVAVTANTDADLFVADEPAGSLSLLAHRGGEDRLLPGSYGIRLERDGYVAWRKEAVVQEGLLTDFPRVLLLPTDEAAVTDLRAEASRSLAAALRVKPRTASISGDGWSLPAAGVLGYQVSSGGDRVLWWTRNELWVLWIRSTDYQPYHSAGDRALISRWSVPIVRAAWFRGADHIVVDLGGAYRVIETDTRGGTNIVRF